MHHTEWYGCCGCCCLSVISFCNDLAKGRAIISVSRFRRAAAAAAAVAMTATIITILINFRTTGGQVFFSLWSRYFFVGHIIATPKNYKFSETVLGRFFRHIKLIAHFPKKFHFLLQLDNSGCLNIHSNYTHATSERHGIFFLCIIQRESLTEERQNTQLNRKCSTGRLSTFHMERALIITYSISVWSRNRN